LRSREELEHDLAEWIIDFEPFEKVRTLGRGTYGVVKLMRNPRTKNEYAVKVFNNCGTDVSFLREIDALIALTHPCVLPIRGLALAKGESGGRIATDFMPKGSLEDILHKVREGKAPEFWTHDRAAVVIAGLAIGMRYIHQLGYMHRDLKPANLLLDANYRVRIGDMGTAKIGESDLTQTMKVGTPLYGAPDVYDSSNYDGSIDVYSFTLVWYEIITGTRAFTGSNGIEHLIRCVREGIRPTVPDCMPVKLRELMTTGWDVKPQERKSFAQICAIFRECGWKFWPDVDSRAVAAYVNEIELWEKAKEQGNETEDEGTV
jgi:serine/threonine protein kinase